MLLWTAALALTLLIGGVAWKAFGSSDSSGSDPSYSPGGSGGGQKEPPKTPPRK